MARFSRKPFQIFQKVIFIFLSMCFLWIGCGTLGLLAQTPLASSRNQGFVLFFGLFQVVVLILLLRAAYLWTGAITKERTQYMLFWGQLLFMCLCFLVLLLQFDANLRNDAYQDADTACYLTDHPFVPEDNKHPGELLSFGNNYFFIYVTSKLIALMFKAGITAPVIYLQSINALAMVIGAAFTWLFVRDAKDIRCANQTLLALTINPLFYGFTFWYYSNSLSIPVMMAVAWLSLRLNRCRRLKIKVLYSVIMGILLFLGYQLRPTAVFPFIAALVVLTSMIKDISVVRRLLPCGVMILVTTAVLFGAFSHIRNDVFGELIPHNRPITYWLSMGSHGTGNLETNGSDVDYVKSLSDDDNKTAAMLRRAVSHYIRNGIPGTIDLWARKTQTTWSDGYGGISRRIISGEAKSPLYAFLAGDSKDLFIIYCQAFRLFTAFGCLLCFFFSMKKGMNKAMFLAAITLLGGVVFYFFWEARAFYSAPFVPVMLIIACDGYHSLFERKHGFLSHYHRFVPLPFICFMLATLFVGMEFVSATGYMVSKDHFRIYTKGKPRHYAAITSTDPILDISQDFYVYKPFNRISIPAKCKKVPLNFSSYTMSLEQDGREVFSKKIKASSITKNRIKLSINPGLPEGHYTLNIKKDQPKKADITFFKKYDSYYLDAYKGELYVNGSGGYVNDLGLTVLLHVNKEPYLPKAVRYVLSLLIMISTALIVLANIRPPHVNRTRERIIDLE